MLLILFLLTNLKYLISIIYGVVKMEDDKGDVFSELLDYGDKGQAIIQ